LPSEASAKIGPRRSLAADRAGDRARAVADFTEALRLDPDDANGYADRGNAYMDEGDGAHAVADLTEAVRRNLVAAPVFNNLGWILATCRNPAIRNGAEATAYAETGDFTDAITWEEKSLKSQSSPDKIAPAEHRLDLYKKGIAHRE
jgi:serine/threonine-protein kinase